MKIVFNNIGNIDNGTIHINKKLTVFTGPNNSGKTYASYCLYGLSRNYSNFNTAFFDKIFSNLFDNFFNTGVVEIDLTEIFTKENIQLILNFYSKEFGSFLPRLFGTDSEQFSNSSIKLELEDNIDIKNFVSSYNFGISGSGHGANISVSYSKIDAKIIVRLNVNTVGQDGIDKTTIDIQNDVISSVKRNIIQFSFNSWTLNAPYFIPAERIGISVFSKDLVSERFTRTNELLTLDEPNRNKVLQLMLQGFNTYSLVIQDALRIQENYSRFKDSSTTGWVEAKALADDLEKEILGGNLLVNQEGNVVFSSNNKNIKIQVTGSIIKSLASFVFYLRYYARKGQTLIFDEPELNLHPDNQIIVARALARLVNIGVNVIVSTHSDYIIRELNVLIMLHKKSDKTEGLLGKYSYSKSELLDFSHIDSYFFDKRTIEQVEVKEVGFEVSTIDNAISNQNKRINDIRWTLGEE